jgi:hypothetical protein
MIEPKIGYVYRIEPRHFCRIEKIEGDTIVQRRCSKQGAYLYWGEREVNFNDIEDWEEIGKAKTDKRISETDGVMRGQLKRRYNKLKKDLVYIKKELDELEKEPLMVPYVRKLKMEAFMESIDQEEMDENSFEKSI